MSARSSIGDGMNGKIVGLEEVIDDFEIIHAQEVEEILLLGKDGGVRRIKVKDL